MKPVQKLEVPFRFKYPVPVDQVAKHICNNALSKPMVFLQLAD